MDHRQLILQSGARHAQNYKEPNRRLGHPMLPLLPVKYVSDLLLLQNADVLRGAAQSDRCGLESSGVGEAQADRFLPDHHAILHIIQVASHGADK